MPRDPARVEEGHTAAWGTHAPLSFDAFFADEAEVLFRRMWLITRDRQEAEEVAQDAFVSLFERWDRVSVMEDPTGYLYRTAMNAWRKRSRRAARAIRTALVADPGRDAFEAADARSVVGAALDLLSPRQRAAVVLVELLGYPSEEAGELMGIRAVTVRVLASQARAAIRAQIGGADG